MVVLSTVEKWHAKLRHPSVYALIEVLRHKKFPKVCKGRPKAKLRITRHNFNFEKWPPLDRVWMDLIRPVQPETLPGQRYALTTRNTSTKACKVYLAPGKGNRSGFLGKQSFGSSKEEDATPTQSTVTILVSRLRDHFAAKRS